MNPISSDSAEIVAMFFKSEKESIERARSFSFFVTSKTEASIPFLKSITLILKKIFSTFFNPISTNFCVRTIDVVVPSPACSFVFSPTSFIKAAPISSKGSSKIIDREIDTPSFVTIG